VGIDAVFGAINGANERDKLNGLIDELQTCLTKAQVFNDAVASKTTDAKNGIVAQEQLFIKLINALSKLKTPTFPYEFGTGFDNMAKFLAAQHTALGEYGIFVDLRNYYCDAKTRNPLATKEEIIDHYMLTAPVGVTKAIVESYWTVLANNSEAVKNNQTCPK
jgi:hypothetical protein